MDRSNQMQWCEVCSVMCMDDDLLKLHFQGQKHKTKLQMLEIIREGGEAPNTPKWCELCTLWCCDEFAFKQHLEGKKHILKLHAMKKEKK
uniref:Zinc finger RNA-binding protein 2 n=3 Tax=Cajanus cajan TaxID=3821 RepID=A0A151QZA0_CAJCA|nr:Zinc finger RNA-binding protein 2 [Cajanus cajan]